jgi:hypothetical protein
MNTNITNSFDGWWILLQYRQALYQPTSSGTHFLLPFLLGFTITWPSVPLAFGFAAGPGEVLRRLAVSIASAVITSARPNRDAGNDPSKTIWRTRADEMPSASAASVVVKVSFFMPRDIITEKIFTQL